MRKLFSIILCALILFNMVGYYGLFLGLRYKNDRDMSQKLDSENYSDVETITIKVPLNLPYGSNSKTFERIDGKFERNGQFYRMAKQSLSGDTLYIVCILDNKEKKISNFMADMTKLSNDLPFSSANKKLLNSLIKDYVSSLEMEISSHQGWSSDQAFVEFRFDLFEIFSSTSYPPPKFIS